MTKPLPYGRTFTQMAQLSAVWTTAASWHKIQQETPRLKALYEFLALPIGEWPVDRIPERTAARRKAEARRARSSNPSALSTVW